MRVFKKSIIIGFSAYAAMTAASLAGELELNGAFDTKVSVDSVALAVINNDTGSIQGVSIGTASNVGEATIDGDVSISVALDDTAIVVENSGESSVQMVGVGSLMNF